MGKVIRLIYPQARRYSGNLSTHKVTGLATSHSGLTILAEILKQKGHDVKVFDERIAPVPLGNLVEADLVGISAQTIDSPQGYRIAKAVRERGVPVVIGGVHASLNPQEALEHADFVVRNEGEETLPELIDEMDRPTPDYSEILGLSYHHEGKPMHNEARPFIEDLDTVPFANFRLIDGWERLLMNPLNFFVYFFQVSRGCDFPCNFCSVTRAFGQRFRARSIDNVIEELKTRPRPSQKSLFFLDDSLACDPDYFKSLLERLITEDLVPEYGWHSQMRLDAALDKEMLDLMQRTNCVAITCGFESINPQTLKYMKKGQTPDRIRRAVKNLHDREIAIIGFWVFGSDYDTVDTIRDTLRFVIEEEVDICGFMPMTPFPGTPFYQDLESQGRIFTKNWELYDVEHVVYHPAKMTPLELFDEINRCYYEFFRMKQVVKGFRRAFTYEREIPWLSYLAMVLWPTFKYIAFAQEKIANIKYRQALHDYSVKGDEKALERLDDPEFDSERLHDFLNHRTARKYWRMAARVPESIGGSER
jgi:radical SAM superfamily enzyme YgiQ (UPF0313 family)